MAKTIIFYRILPYNVAEKKGFKGKMLKEGGSFNLFLGDFPYDFVKMVYDLASLFAEKEGFEEFLNVKGLYFPKKEDLFKAVYNRACESKGEYIRVAFLSTLPSKFYKGRMMSLFLYNLKSEGFTVKQGFNYYVYNYKLLYEMKKAIDSHLKSY